ncbi:hypothetical protein B0H14DRAFT_2625423 [Mycena olivaceomarginata]|nr:hypothetical protein B0H14DRAFT_2625423 [Mycena olivaceomarginata]
MSSLSSWIKRQSRVIRRSTLSGLTSILEEEPALRMKAKRRHGVSDLAALHRRAGHTHTHPSRRQPADMEDSRKCSKYRKRKNVSSQTWKARLTGTGLELTAKPDTVAQRGDNKSAKIVLRLVCLDSDYECPRPRPPLPRCDSPTSDSSESEGSRSGSASPVLSGLPTTPTPSPTAESYDVAAELKGQAVIRCKTIKPLAIVKRAVSPVPPPPQPVASTSTLPAADECEEEDDDAWQDDDEYYAAHAGSFITLAPPLPPSFPASPSCESLPMSAALPSSRALRRESAIIPTASVRRSPAVRASIPIPTRAPPPPPIVTSSAYCHSYTLAVTPAPPSASHLSPASVSRPSPALARSRTRAPPKTPLPTDALSTPWSGDWTAYAPFGTPSPSSSQHSHSSDSDSACSSSSERLAALLSPPPAPSSPQRRFPAETQGVPSDVSSSEWEEEEEEAWEACAVSYGDAYEEVPLSPLVACVPSSPSPSSSSPLAPSPTEEKWNFPPSPLPLPNPAFASASACSGSAPIAGPGRYTGWHPRPRASQLRLALAVEPLSLLVSQQQQRCQQEPERTLRSRWSSSTLSSVHSAHAHGRRSPGVASSPKTFAFARAAGVRRYMHFPKAPGQKPKPKPMGSATVLSTPKRGKGKGGKRLTVEDVLVISPAPPSPAPVPAPPTPTCGATANAPRQRWSYSSRASSSRAAPSGSESSDSGHSDSDDCGSECSGGSGSEGMRRKPIPVGLFLR